MQRKKNWTTRRIKEKRKEKQLLPIDRNIYVNINKKLKLADLSCARLQILYIGLLFA